MVNNTAAGLPAGLRDVTPFALYAACRGLPTAPFGNDRTVLRGGAGYFNITTTGGAVLRDRADACSRTTRPSRTITLPARTPRGPPPLWRRRLAFPNTSASGQFAPALGQRLLLQRHRSQVGTIPILCRQTCRWITTSVITSAAVSRMWDCTRGTSSGSRSSISLPGRARVFPRRLRRRTIRSRTSTR